MIRTLPILLLLAACGTAQTTSYALGGGVATYDELQRATELCRERGGRIEPHGKGGYPYQLSNYTCVIGGGS
jgi:hypothetical protein